MEYRRFGKTEEEVSILGYGCMRLPILDNDSNKINEELAMEQIRYAIDNGVNYVDTAYPYHGGHSESFVAKVLKDGYREKVKLATKLPSWLIKKPEDLDKYLNEQLANLETDYIDFYLIHALNNDFWTNLKQQGLFEFMDRAKAEGRIKHIGFSFHDQFEVFEDIINAYDWEFCQIQMNYFDEDYQAGVKGMEIAHSKDMGVVVMEPLRGGNLADTSKIAPEILDMWKSKGQDFTPAQWALKYVYNYEAVSLALSGMNDIDHIKENIKTASSSPIGHLSEADNELIGKVKDMYKSRIKVGCTGCNYCMPCPAGVDIPGNFELYNNAHMLNPDTAAYSRKNFMDPSSYSDQCVECGACQPQCPQNISIIEELKKVTEYFASL